jgi:hypothetical protein
LFTKKVWATEGQVSRVKTSNVDSYVLCRFKNGELHNASDATSDYAVTRPTGYSSFVDGVRHHDTAAALSDEMHYEVFVRDGHIHRNNGPAVKFYQLGWRQWWTNGMLTNYRHKTSAELNAKRFESPPVTGEFFT